MLGPARASRRDVSAGWTEQRERGNLFALRLILWIALRMGRPAARAILYPIVLYFLVKAAPQRRASRAFLTRALGRPAGLRDVARHIHCFSATILDRVFLLAGRQDALSVTVHNDRLVADRVAAGTGFLLLGSHLGSFEIMRALAVERQGIPLRVLMDSKHNRALTDLLDRLNPAVAATVLPLAGPATLLAVKEILDSGGVVGLLGDRYAPGETTAACDFFGSPALFPVGPLTLAAASGVPVVLLFGLYRGGNRYDVYFEDLAQRVPLDRSDRAREVRDWVQRYAERLEHYTRQAPYNWFNFYDFWGDGDAS